MLPFHPLADLFPMIGGAERDELVADIRANTLRERIVMLDGMILDGRNRYMAAIDAGVIRRDADPETEASLYVTHFRRFVPQQDGDPLAWVLSKNLHRRHLTDGQRAMVAARLANMRQGERTDLVREDGEPSANLPKVSNQDAADRLHVSERTVRTAKDVVEHGAPELVERVEKGEVAVSAAAEVAKLPVTEQLRILREQHPREFARAAKEVREKPRDARAVMASRAEPDDSLDYFPTPPWATRALAEHALPELGQSLKRMMVREPACGEGHMAEVLGEYAFQVWATDVFDYSANGREPPHWRGTRDYLDESESFAGADWVITNPPFEDKAQGFVLRALREVNVGVAMFMRLGWLETVGRYEAIFRDTPPTMIAFFAERVNLCKGRWDPQGSTASAYCWLIWVKGAEPRAPIWIPPGRREALTRPDDVERFTAHPVIGRTPLDLDEGPVVFETTEDGEFRGVSDDEPGASSDSDRAIGDVSDKPTMPHPPGAHPVEFTVGGMRQTATATFAVRRDGAKFVPSFRWEFPGFEGARSEASEPAVFFDQALRAVMDKLIEDLSGVRDSDRPGYTDKHRAAARAGIAWLERQKVAWGLEAPADDEFREDSGKVEEGAAPAPSSDDVRVPATFEQARPILEARYESEPGQALADELGIPIGTLRTWAFKLDLTAKARIAARGQAMVAEFNQLKDSVPDINGNPVRAGGAVFATLREETGRARYEVRRVYKNGSISIDDENGHQVVLKRDRFEAAADVDDMREADNG